MAGGQYLQFGIIHGFMCLMLRSGTRAQKLQSSELGFKAKSTVAAIADVRGTLVYVWFGGAAIADVRGRYRVAG